MSSGPAAGDVSSSGVFAFLQPRTQAVAHHPIPNRDLTVHGCRTETVVFRSDVGGFSTEERIAFDLPQYYNVAGSIAKGTYGYVIKATDATDWANAKLPSGADPPDAVAKDRCPDVAIKKIPSIWNDARFWICAIRELTIMHFVNHPKVMGLRDFYVSVICPTSPQPTKAALERSRLTFDTVYCVMDCMDFSLQSLMEKESPERRIVGLPENAQKYFPDGEVRQPLPADTRRYVMFQIMCGLCYLHRCGIVHRDLKPANILMKSDWTVKIADLGQGRGLYSGALADTNRMNCTLLYASPETFVLGQDSNAAGQFDFDQLKAQDLWSVGCIWAEMIVGLPLMVGPNGATATTSVMRAAFGLLGRPSAEEIGQLKSNMSAQECRELDMITSRIKTDVNQLKSVLLACDPECEMEADAICSLLKYAPLQRSGLEDILKTDFFPGWFDDATDIGATPHRYQFQTKQHLQDPAAAREILWDLFLTHHPGLKDTLYAACETAVEA